MRRGKGSSETPERQALDWFGPRVPLVSLRYVLAVSECLNFRHAATVLQTTQSSVSSRIKALEEALGIQLFERRHRGVRLTEAGRRFVAQVSIGIGHLDHAIRTAGAVSSGRRGRIAIGFTSSIASGFLADLRAQFRSKFPEVEQIVTEDLSAQTVAMVREGSLDIAFVLGAVNAPDCHQRPLWREMIILAISTNHPLAHQEIITWFDLVNENFLVQHGGAGPQVFEHVLRRISERERSPRVDRCDVARDTLMGMVAAGDGITLTSEATTYVPFPGVVFRPITDETEPARFSAVWSPHNRSQALTHLLNLATEMSRSARSF